MTHDVGVQQQDRVRSAMNAKQSPLYNDVKDRPPTARHMGIHKRHLEQKLSSS